MHKEQNSKNMNKEELLEQVKSLELKVENLEELHKKKDLQVSELHQENMRLKEG